MGALYPGTSVSGYNSNPPPDDGSTGANNQITWAGIKSKVGDPLNTFASAVDSNITSAFGKTISGASVVSTAVNYPMTAADQGRNIVATASGITITTPDATVVHSPFVMAVNNQSSGNITVAGFSAQNIDGANTAKLGKGRGLILWTDGSNWFSTGLVMGNLPLANPPFGFDAPINLQLNASIGSNLLTIAVKANDGTDPTTSNPVLIPFGDATGGNGDPVWVAVTSALSINTNAVGASLGTVNSVPFRLWIVAFNNAGTAVLALWQGITGGSSPTALSALNEGVVQSTTGISAAATSAGVFYTPNGTTLTNRPFRILGYAQFSAGLATAGTYSSAPDYLRLFGPGIHKPGDVIQLGMATTTTTVNNSTNSFVSSNLTTSISLSQACNLVRVKSHGGLVDPASMGGGLLQMFRGSAGLGVPLEFANNSASSIFVPFSTLDFDAPGTVSSTSYTLKFSSDGTHTVSVPSVASGSGARIEVEEIMV